jgi:hypothetical protein
MFEKCPAAKAFPGGGKDVKQALHIDRACRHCIGGKHSGLQSTEANWA